MRSIRSMVAVVIVGLMIAGRVDASALIPQKQEKIAAQTKTSGKGFWNRNKSDTNGEKTKRNAREFGKRFLNELFGPPKPTERPTPSREDIHNALYTKGDRFKHNFLRVFPVLLLLGSGVIAAEVGAKAYAEEVLGTDILNPQKGDLEDVYDKTKPIAKIFEDKLPEHFAKLKEEGWNVPSEEDVHQFLDKIQPPANKSTTFQVGAEMMFDNKSAVKEILEAPDNETKNKVLNYLFK